MDTIDDKRYGLVMKRSDEEHKIQCKAVKHARQRWPICRTNLIAIPNGGARDVVTGRRLKDEGVLKGVWDLFLAYPILDESEFEDGTPYTATVSGLWIEVKRPGMQNRKRGGLTPEQEAFGREMTRQGYATAVCYTTQGILETIENYLRRKSRFRWIRRGKENL